MRKYRSWNLSSIVNKDSLHMLQSQRHSIFFKKESFLSNCSWLGDSKMLPSFHLRLQAFLVRRAKKTLFQNVNGNSEICLCFGNKFQLTSTTSVRSLFIPMSINNKSNLASVLPLIYIHFFFTPPYLRCQ